MPYIDWDEIIGGIVILMIVALSTVGIVAICKDHHVRSYYVNTANVDKAIGGISCVYADNPWEGDDVVYCSSSPQQVLDYARQANELLKTRK